jgi:hypothetical protein
MLKKISVTAPVNALSESTPREQNQSVGNPDGGQQAAITGLRLCRHLTLP